MDIDILGLMVRRTLVMLPAAPFHNFAEFFARDLAHLEQVFRFYSAPCCMPEASLLQCSDQASLRLRKSNLCAQYTNFLVKFKFSSRPVEPSSIPVHACGGIVMMDSRFDPRGQGSLEACQDDQGKTFSLTFCPNFMNKDVRTKWQHDKTGRLISRRLAAYPDWIRSSGCR